YALAAYFSASMTTIVQVEYRVGVPSIRENYCSCFCPAANTVQGPAFISRSNGFCQANSVWRSRNSAARKSAPQGWPALATKLIFAAMALSVALPCTAPPGLYASQPHSLTPLEEASTWPHRARSLGWSFFSKLSTWSERNCSANVTSTLPLFCCMTSSQRAWRAFMEEDLSFGSKPLVSS